MSFLLRFKIFLKKIPYRKAISHLRIGNNSELLIPFHISNPKNLSIGDYCYINSQSWFSTIGKVTIKSGVIIGPRFKVYTGNHNYKSLTYIPYDQITFCEDVVINENVWIGGDVIILPGVTIGEGAVIAAGSVVVKDVDACTVVGGNPAKKISERDAKTYYKLKSENKIYLKYKLQNRLRQEFRYASEY